MKNFFPWEDLEKQAESLKNSPIDTDKEKLDYFKEKILGHLDKLQKEENYKKIIPFPKEKKNGK